MGLFSKFGVLNRVEDCTTILFTFMWILEHFKRTKHHNIGARIISCSSNNKTWSFNWFVIWFHIQFFFFHVFTKNQIKVSMVEFLTNIFNVSELCFVAYLNEKCLLKCLVENLAYMQINISYCTWPNYFDLLLMKLCLGSGYGDLGLRRLPFWGKW